MSHEFPSAGPSEQLTHCHSQNYTHPYKPVDNSPDRLKSEYVQASTYGTRSFECTHLLKCNEIKYARRKQKGKRSSNMLSRSQSCLILNPFLNRLVWYYERGHSIQHWILRCDSLNQFVSTASHTNLYRSLKMSLYIFRV